MNKFFFGIALDFRYICLNMKITIHRGTNQIGGCVTEYEENGWRLFVDYGEQLPSANATDKPLKIDGLTHGDISKSALLLTHYHGDHIGKITELPTTLPIYMGKLACEIQTYASTHISQVDDKHAKIVARLKQSNRFLPGERFKFGGINIMPINIDHSAFDAYAFVIEAGGTKVLHTGDFRTHGFRSSKFPKVVKTLIGKIDYVVCEGTNISRPDSANQSEQQLQQAFKQAFRDNKYNIVYLSSTNIDRLFGLYHAALSAHRPFCIDGYQKHIMNIIVGSNSLWNKSPLYRYGKYEPICLQRDGKDFHINQKFIDFTANQGYVLIARASKRFDDLIAKMPGYPKQRYLSMWKGYTDPDNAAFNPTLAQPLGEDFRYMHTSGHCDAHSLGTLFEMLSPRAIIPMHTDNPAEFLRQFGNRWKIILLNDGETFNTLSL